MSLKGNALNSYYVKWSMRILSYLVFCCLIYICKLRRINEERELIFLLSITHNYVVSVRRGFVFLLVFIAELFYCGSHWNLHIIEPRCEKTGLRGFRPGPTLTGLYNHRICLDA